MADANVVRLKLGRIGLGSSTPKAVPARAKGRCEMMPDPTPPYRVPDFALTAARSFSLWWAG